MAKDRAGTETETEDESRSGGSDSNIDRFFERIGGPERMITGNKWVRYYEEGVWIERHLDSFGPLAAEVIEAAETSHRIRTTLDLAYLKCQRLGVDWQGTVRFDANDTLLNTVSGVVRMKSTGSNGDAVSLEDHSPNHYFTGKLISSYDRKATCPFMDSLVKSQLPDEEDRRLFWIYCGNAFRPNRKLLPSMLICYGATGTGKSTLFLQGIGLACLGAENISTLSMTQINGHPNRKNYDLPRMVGKVLNISTEQEMTTIEDTSNVKRITSGEYVTVEQKFRDGTDAIIHTAPVFICNKLPVLNNATDADLRRLRILAFNYPLKWQEGEIEARLAQERSGILNRLIEGLLGAFPLREMPYGGMTSARIRESYGREFNPIEGFLREECNVTGNREDFETSSDALKALQEYAERKELEINVNLHTVARKLQACRRQLIIGEDMRIGEKVVKIIRALRLKRGDATATND